MTPLKSLFENYLSLFSFLGSFTETRIDRIRKMILSRSDAEAIKNDFDKVGEDIRSSMKKIDTKKEVPELYLCD